MSCLRLDGLLASQDGLRRDDPGFFQRHDSPDADENNHGAGAAASL
jgi:hypothetical protein